MTIIGINPIFASTGRARFEADFTRAIKKFFNNIPLWVINSTITNQVHKIVTANVT